MSCIVAIKGDNNCSAIISDFRLTQKDSEQVDSVLKYIEVNNLVIFMAGSVFCLEIIQNEIQKLAEITYTDINSRNSSIILLIEQLLNNYVPGKNNERNSFIIIYLESSTRSHKLIKIDYLFNKDRWNVIDFINGEEYEWEVIGAGDIITDEKYFKRRTGLDLYKTFNEMSERFDCYESACGILQEINSRLEIIQEMQRKEADNNEYNIYEDLGISPILNFALVQYDKYSLEYTENEVVKITNKGLIKTAEYSIESDNNEGVILTDKLNNTSVFVSKPFRKNEAVIGDQNTFDPELKEKKI